MEAAERDTTDEWRVAPARAPATVAELEGRIDVAIATAQAAEEAALEIGAASLEAADQARRAAALAERASAAAVRAADAASAPPGAPVPSAPVAVSAEAPSVEAPPRSGLTSDAPPSDLLASVEPSTTSPPASNGASPPDSDPFEERIAAFQERAERVMVRLRRLEAPGSTAGLR